MNSANQPASFQEALEPLLDLIDKGLGLDDVPVRDRSIKAARKLIKDFIPQIQFGNDAPRSPGEFVDFSSEPWFKAIYGHVDKWYHLRYGLRITVPNKGMMRGITIIASTPFEFRVPITSSQVEVVGETAWLSFPDSLLPDDDVRSWVMNPPNWETYSDELQKESEELMREVAVLLRRISSRMIGAYISDPFARNVLAGVKVHLDSAAALISREGEEGSYARAQWELQMACESAYKGLLQQKTGSFPKTHDLFTIHDRARIPESSVKRQWIRELPRWSEACNLRYGLGDHPTTVGIFYWYKLTLKIIAGTVDNLDGLNLSETRVLLKMAPWLRSSSNDENVIEEKT